HSAGAFGEDDKVVTDREGIEPVMPVGKDGRFTHPVEEYAGMLVFDANLHIIDDLKAVTASVTPGTVLLRRETYDHSYPHCWRCREPLIYKGVSSWFVEVTAVKERLLELNEEIRWVPDHIQHGSFGKWLANARDWSITRNRFWGSPVPVWKSDDEAYPRLDVYGSLAEMERDFGRLPVDHEGNPDLHRPFIDDLTRPNPDDPTGTSTMRRVADVLDVWFDSGSMSFAQVHYPFENADWFEGHFPGDFIVEYIGQTRGWFYTMHVLAGAIFDKPAFSTCVSHGIVLGSDGAKMSKSLRNYPDVREVFDRDGADAMRWFLMSSPILRGGNLVVTEQGIRDSVRQVLIPLWNSWYFFSLYANAARHDDGAGYDAAYTTASSHPMDRYILAKLRDHVAAMAHELDNYEVAGACDSTRSFLDVLTNWYIRRSRDRFWAGDADAFDTLHTALEVLCRVAAPLLPLTSEAVYTGLTGSPSVHLTDWPSASSYPADSALVAAMDRVRDVCSVTSSVRKSAGLRVRLPLTSVTVASADAESLAPFTSIIADEMNVKSVNLTTDLGSAGRFELQVVPGALGPRVGKAVQPVFGAVKKGEWTPAADGTITAAGIELQEGEFSLRLVAADADRSAALPANDDAGV
ncbi:class I tRNA ligase family protein, partial [Nocardioides sp.]|uniref:class I tRNA ligase family protein n=1 Tax=Nocardioides sp. TaxID=35761 RepID=UPI00286EA80C